MTRLRRCASALAVGAFLLSIATAGPVLAHGHGGGGSGAGAGHAFGGGHFGHFGFGPRGHHGFRVFRGPAIVVGGGGFFYDPFAYPYYAYGYPPAYPYGWYPPAEDESNAPPPSTGEVPVPLDASGGAALGALDNAVTSGLVRLLDVPDGATLSLDGQYWLEAHDLDHYWFRLPAGTHTIGVRASGQAPVDRQVDVVAGRPQDVILGPHVG